MRSATLMPDVEETSDLSKSLEEKLQAALEQAGGAASDVVLVLDLDETLFTPLAADGLATSVWFEDLLKRWAPRLRDADGMTSEDTLEQALAVVDRFYARVPVGPTDPSLGGLLNWCRSEGVVSIGLTARRPALAAVTWEQVGDRVPLDFNSQALPLGPDTIERMDKSLRSSGHFAPDRTAATWEGLSFERGVWFTANANKGAVLRQVLPPGRHVVFADDSLRHVHAVRGALDGHAASVFGLHFTAATAAARKRLDPPSCDRSLAGHLSALFSQGDPGVAGLVREGQPLLRRFIAEQAASQGAAAAPGLRALAAALAAPRASGSRSARSRSGGRGGGPAPRGGAAA